MVLLTDATAANFTEIDSGCGGVAQCDIVRFLPGAVPPNMNYIGMATQNWDIGTNSGAMPLNALSGHQNGLSVGGGAVTTVFQVARQVRDVYVVKDPSAASWLSWAHGWTAETSSERCPSLALSLGWGPVRRPPSSTAISQQARLERVDFQSSSFVRCRFAGELHEIMFYDHGFNTGKPDPNPMESVDFSDAVLHDVEFRHLNLDSLIFPKGPGHQVVHHYRCVLGRAMAALAGDDTAEARRLTVSFEHRLQWAGPQQEVGVFSLLDHERRWDSGLAERAAELLRRCEGTCAERYGSRDPGTEVL